MGLVLAASSSPPSPLGLTGSVPARSLLRAHGEHPTSARARGCEGQGAQPAPPGHGWASRAFHTPISSGEEHPGKTRRENPGLSARTIFGFSSSGTCPGLMTSSRPDSKAVSFVPESFRAAKLHLSNPKPNCCSQKGLGDSTGKQPWSEPEAAVTTPPGHTVIRIIFNCSWRSLTEKSSFVLSAFGAF